MEVAVEIEVEAGWKPKTDGKRQPAEGRRQKSGNEVKGVAGR